MKQTQAGFLALGLAILLTAWRPGSADGPQLPPDLPDASLKELFNGQLNFVDLTWTMNEKTPYWPGGSYQPLKVTTIATIEKNGVLSKALAFPEHLGTHLDAPNHFEKKQPSVDQIVPGQLFAPGVVIDITPLAEQDPDFRLRVEDIARWEAEHGRIPDRAVVFLRTGWARHWTNYDRYKNQDLQGKLHFPGYSAEAARFLVESRHVRGVGIDTLSIDYGLSTDFIVHHVVNGAGRYGLENVANLEKLPPRGFGLIVAPIKVEGGTGGPVRLFAILPK